MLIHIEAKRRWSITISTSRHRLADKPTTPSTRSCACSHSTIAVPVDDAKSPSIPSHPRDPSSTTVSRCRTFLRKLCRVSVRTCRMDPQQYAEAVHDESPPPYGSSYGYELPAMPLHELSDRLMLAPELEGDHVFAELEGLMERTQDHSLESDMSQASFLDLNETDECDATPVRRSSTNADAPMLLWALNTQYHSVSAPSMISGRQSHKSSPSPVSPVTPDVNGICSARFYSNANRPVSTVSPLESFPPNDFDLPRSFRMDTDWSHPSLEASHAESFRGIAQQPAKGLDGRQDGPLGSSVPFGLANHESHVPGVRSPPALGQCLPELRSQRHDATGIRFGTYELSEHQEWHFTGGYEQDAAKDEDIKRQESTAQQPESLQYAHRFGGNQGPPTNFVELEDYQYPQFCEVLEQNGNDAPLEHCNKCGKTFRGRYRKGNLRRHNLAFHNPLAVVVGSACRVCKKAYKRTDATRKHEWKNHRILDAMPKKRTK